MDNLTNLNQDAGEIIEQWEKEISEQTELEMLDEVCLYSEKGYSLHINPVDKQDNGFSLNPYVKIYDNESYNKANADIRIDLNDGHITSHRDGKKDLKMTKKLANKTTDLINNGVCNNGEYKGQKIIDAINTIMAQKYPDNYLHLMQVDLSNFYEGKKHTKTKQKKN